MNPVATKNKSLSFVEQLDPRVKVVSLLLIALQVFAIPYDSSLVAATGILAVGFLISHINPFVMARRLLSVSVFVFLIVGVNMFSVDGNVVFAVAGLYATQEGMWMGIILSWRIVLLIVAATIFVQTTSIPAMIDGVEAALKPMRQHTKGLTQVLTIALNFVPMLIQSAQQIKKAQIARGADPDRNMFRQIEFAFSATVPLFAMALRSSEHLASSMDARGYDPHAERSRYSTLSLSAKDAVAISIVTVQFALSLILGR